MYSPCFKFQIQGIEVAWLLFHLLNSFVRTLSIIHSRTWDRRTCEDLIERGDYKVIICIAEYDLPYFCIDLYFRSNPV